MSPKAQRITIAMALGWRKWKFGDPWVLGLRLADTRFNGYIRRVIKDAPSNSLSVMLDIDETPTKKASDVVRDYIPMSHWISKDGLIKSHPPNYLSDLNAAASLCDLLADQGWQCEANNGLNKSWECIFFREATENTRPENKGKRQEYDLVDSEEHYCAADTLAEAICGAFLRTLNLWKENA